MEDNIEMDLQALEWGMDWIDLIQDRVNFVQFLDFMVSNSFDCYYLGNVYSIQRFSFPTFSQVS
jgi:hypothetical protein